MLTATQTTKYFLHFDIDVVDDRNIDRRGLGVKGVHMNSSGINRLPKKFLIKNFWVDKGYSGILINKVREWGKLNVFFKDWFFSAKRW